METFQRKVFERKTLLSNGMGENQWQTIGGEHTNKLNTQTNNPKRKTTTFWNESLSAEGFLENEHFLLLWDGWKKWKTKDKPFSPTNGELIQQAGSVVLWHRGQQPPFCIVCIRNKTHKKQQSLRAVHAMPYVAWENFPADGWTKCEPKNKSFFP